jgi:WD40 repeat protein
MYVHDISLNWIIWIVLLRIFHVLQEAVLVQTPSKTLDLVALSPLCVSMKQTRGRIESKATSSSAAVLSPSSSASASSSNGLVACTSGATLYFYRVNGTLLFTIDTAHRGGIRSISFTADGRHVFTSGGDKAVKIWRLPSSSAP